MPGVVDEPLSRLYAGALLGKALAKETGEVGAQQGQLRLSARRATLTAGIASGSIDPSKLSNQDAGLLGSALAGGHVKIPSLVSDPLGFLGHFAKNFGKGAGEFAESLKGVPQGLLGLGEAAGEELGRAVTPPGLRGKQAPLSEKLQQIAGGVAHDFSSPQQIYEHPFNPFLDVASVASGGIGGAVKGAGALSRAGAFTEGGSLSGLAGAANKVIGLGSTLGRPDAIASPGFTADNIEHFGEIAPARTPRPYSPNLGMKYVVQKPLDTAISKLKDLQLPSGESLGDLQGRYYGRKLINRTRAQISAGTNEAFMKGPVGDFLHSTTRMYKNGQAAGQYQFEAAMLHSLGVNKIGRAHV